LAALTRTPGIQIDIVSGRPRGSLDAWLGELPLALWAEHGFWHRPCPSQPWQAAMSVTPHWMDRVRPILEQFAASTPGATIEVKSASIAWHYRGVARESGARQAHELRMLLGDALSNQPLDVLEGKKVIEVRWRGIGKSIVAQRALAEAGTDTVIVAIGDDRTDEELFRALPASSVTVAVGREATDAAFQLADCRAVRRLLQGLLSDDSGLLRCGERPERVPA
jgi:trehalose 6-phosphate synthase/phosphatase